jgi:lipopolysaccharide biosynthesis regulator YciM
MNSLYIEYRDPLFGIILFFVLIFVIALFSYWWGRFKTKDDHRHLDKFLRQFQAPPSENEIKELIASSKISSKSWLLLADLYFQNGEYEKSIEIYHELLSNKQSDVNEKEILFLLGKTYFKAGFLERSKNTFLEILKANPRTPQALRYLLLIYEHLRDYNSALGVLEPLDELGEDVKLDKIYLEVTLLLNDYAVDENEKLQKLVALYKEHRVLSYLIFEYIFRKNPKLGWENLDLSQCQRLSDLLYNLSDDAIDLDIISQNLYLRELFSAKGCVALAQSSGVFEFDLLINLKKCDYKGATLRFEYICKQCKQIYPFAFHRCPSCHAIDSVQSEMVVSKEYGEAYNSFQ